MNIGTTIRPKENFYKNYDKSKIKDSKPNKEQITTIDEQTKESRGMTKWQN